MRALWDRVRSNLPWAKPQLWEDLPRAIARRAVFESCRRVRAGWLSQPQVVTLSGKRTKLEVVPLDAIGRAIYLYGTYEIAVTKFVGGALGPGDVFIDVGANVGYYTVLAADLVQGSGAVHAFEPVAALRARLERNVALNRFPNVTAHAEAVWSESGPLSFYLAEPCGNSGLSSALPGPGRSPTAVQVHAITLDEFVRSHARTPRVIKIDVEGGEGRVLEGARDLLHANNRPALVFESFEVNPIAKKLEGLDFDVRVLEYTLEQGLSFLPIGREADRRSAAYEPPNYVALPREWNRR